MTTTTIKNQNNQLLLPPLRPGTRVLFATVPADGHVNPLTGLAVHLKSMGCDVRWYTSSTYASKITNLGIQHYPFRKALDISGADMDTVFPERNKRKGQVNKLAFDMINVFILRGPEYFDDLIDIYREFPFEIMIADCTFTAIPLVKEKMNLPVIAVGIVPLTESSKDLPPPGLGLTPATTFVGKKLHRLLHVVANKILFGKPNKVMRDVLAGYNIESGGANLFDLAIQKSSIYLQSGTPGFEFKRSDLSSNIRFAGPLLPYAGKKAQPHWFDERLLQYDQVILATQGTVEKDVEKILVPTLEAFKNTNRLVVVTTGGSETENLRQRYPQPNIIIEDFIPFDSIMPYAHVYVSNGGYGGVLLAIQNELPLVVGGVHEGKNEINARVGYFGLGVNLKTERPSPQRVKEAVEEVLRNRAYYRNVKALSAEFSRYNPAELCAAYVAELLQGARTVASRFAFTEDIY